MKEQSLNETVSQDAAGSKQQPGRFRIEREMFAVVTDLVREKLCIDPTRFAVVKEPTIGSVIPDLLFGEWSQEFRSPRRTFNLIEAKILELLEKQDEMAASEISNRLHLSPGAADKALKRIEKTGLIISTRSGQISLDVGSFTRGITVTAVELKLNRWREAVRQAQSYLKFADRSYVVLDADRFAEREDLLSAVRSARVGLLTVRTGRLTEIQPAPTQYSISSQRVRAIQKLVSQQVHPTLLPTGIFTPCSEHL